MATRSPLALITGASSGIGIEFARELARRGYDLILTARRTERLETVKEELVSQFGVGIRTLPGDLGTTEGARRLFEGVQAIGLPVQILVNNAGLGKFGPTLAESLESQLSTIQVNLTSLTVLTRLFADVMKGQGGGYILNNASYSAFQPTPYYAVYSATKAYVLAYSLAIRRDLRAERIRVSALCPGFFRSEFFELAGQEPNFLVRCILLETRSVARAGVAGVLRNKAVIVPGVVYKTLAFAMRFLPRSLAPLIADLAVR